MHIATLGMYIALIKQTFLYCVFFLIWIRKNIITIMWHHIVQPYGMCVLPAIIIVACCYFLIIC